MRLLDCEGDGQEEANYLEIYRMTLTVLPIEEGCCTKEDTVLTP